MRITTAFAAFLLIALLARTATAIVIASDNASDPAYAFNPTEGSWQGENAGSGENPPGDDNGGFGFLPWDFGGGYSQDRPPYGTSPQYIDGVDFPTTSYNNLGSPSFALGTAPVPFSGITTGASRPFAQTLAVGDIFSADIDTPANFQDQSGFSYPFAFVGFADETGVETFAVKAGNGVGGPYPWEYKDLDEPNADFGVAAGGSSIAPTDTSDGSSFSLEILSASTGRFTLDGRSVNIQFIAGLPNSVFFLLYDQEAKAVSGDFNENGTVDAADYVVWRENLGLLIQLPNEGENVTEGEVTAEDYATWRENFGLLTGPTGEHAFFFDNLKIERPDADGARAGIVPEPANVLTLVAGLMTLLTTGTRIARKSR